MAARSPSRWRIVTMAALLLVSLAPAALAAGTTRMVVQWRYDGVAPAELAWQLVASADAIRKGCGNLCIVDGHDVAIGAANIFLYVDDGNVDALVKVLAGLLAKDRLPPGMQVGIAESRADGGAGFVYRPAFPDGLPHFDVAYPAEARGL